MKTRLNNILFACILPLTYTIAWIANTNQLPVNDAANYLNTLLEIYHHFTDQGFLSGLWHAYAVRGWRPIIFPNLSYPLMVLSHGSLFLSYAFMSTVCIIASTVYVYFYLRLVLTAWPAILGTALIGLLPFVQAQIVMFYAESALFPCLIGSLYHLIRSNYLLERKHAWAFIVLLTLAITIRPVEAITHCLFVLSLFFISGWYYRFFTIKQIAIVCASAFTSASIFFFCAMLPHLHVGIPKIVDGQKLIDHKATHLLIMCFAVSSFLSISIWLYLLLLKGNIFTKIYNFFTQKTGQPYFVQTFLWIFFLVLLWFLPTAFGLFDWVYQTSLGEVASSTGSLSGASFSLAVLSIYLHEEGLVAIGGISILAFLAMIFLPWQQNRRICLSLPILYLLLMIPFPFWEAFYTVQIVTRKLSVVFPALLMAMLMIGLQAGNKWKLRFGGLISLVIAQSLLIGGLFVTYGHNYPFLHHTIGYFIPAPSTIRPNPHEVVINFFDESAKTYHLQSFGLEVVPGTPDARHPVEAEPINPFLMPVLLQVQNKSYYASYPYFGTYSENNVKTLKNNFNAIFLSDKLEHMQISAISADYYREKIATAINPSLKTFYELELHYTQNTLSEIGWKVGRCQIIKTQKQGNYLGCLLIAM